MSWWSGLDEDIYVNVADVRSRIDADPEQLGQLHLAHRPDREDGLRHPIETQRVQNAAEDHAECADERMYAARADGRNRRAGAIAVEHHADAKQP